MVLARPEHDPRRAAASANATIDVAGREVPLAVNWRRNARRFVLRLDPRTGGARLTVPDGADLDDAIAFLRRHESWLAREQAKLDGPVALRAGARVPLRGEPHEIVVTGARGGRINVASGEGGPVIAVAGTPDMVAIRLGRWLRGQARADLTAAVTRHGAFFKVTPGPITVRDQRSRWGSCSGEGALSFSWRLVMAPAHVLDYVAAHEVAHLLEMNHGPRFWRLVRDTGVEVDAARVWLARHGSGLHRYGG